MTWLGALWMVIRIAVALAIGKAGFPRISQWLMPPRPKARGNWTPGPLSQRAARSSAPDDC